MLAGKYDRFHCFLAAIQPENHLQTSTTRMPHLTSLVEVMEIGTDELAVGYWKIKVPQTSAWGDSQSTPFAYLTWIQNRTSVSRSHALRVTYQPHNSYSSTNANVRVVANETCVWLQITVGIVVSKRVNRVELVCFCLKGSMIESNDFLVVNKGTFSTWVCLLQNLMKQDARNIPNINMSSLDLVILVI